MKEIFVKNARQISLSQITDGFDGKLSIAEEQNHIPFNIKRVYYIYNLINHEEIIRGKHAHKSTEQVLFCLNGSCNMLLDDGNTKQEICVDNPNIGIYLGVNLWHTMYNFKNNCILLVFASDLYNESDYIRDYNDFLEYLNNSL
jgi:dTDP-4-dehydrorhamnose 3,5-epimerase-like enzyme